MTQFPLPVRDKTEMLIVSHINSAIKSMHIMFLPTSVFIDVTLFYFFPDQLRAGKEDIFKLVWTEYLGLTILKQNE